MNKAKKIAIAAVSVVMAGAMMLPLAACNKKKSPKKLTASQQVLEVSTDADGKLSYPSGLNLNLNIGHEKSTRQTTFTTDLISGTITLPDGKNYTATSFKPAWAALADELGVTFTDKFQKRKGAPQIEDAIKQHEIENKAYDIITGAADTIVSNGLASGNENLWLDLSLYLDYMPNYKAFLENNPLVYMSLTSNTTTGAMYYAPYFDGYNDIEKYVLTKKEWTKLLLDDALTQNGTTFAAQAQAKQTAGRVNGSAIDGSQSSVESYMGTEGTWTIETTNPAVLKDGGAEVDEAKVASGTPETVNVTIDYNAAKTAATTDGEALYEAINSAAGKAYTGTSGNIVDLQNFVINETDGAVTGKQLTEILRAYIDVAYKNAEGGKFYTTRSDVFSSAYAAWDVDLYVAFCRCVVASGGGVLGTKTPDQFLYGLSARENKRSDRSNDVLSFVGELYGIRGLESRLQYGYIDKDGTLHDARQNKETYDFINKAHALVTEGLYNTEQISGGSTSIYSNDKTTNTCEAWSLHDYSQTQTKWGFYAEGKATKSDITVDSTNQGVGEGNQIINSNYNFAPIVTPVSKWDVDGNGEHETIMRFTESWRSTKDSGFCVPRNVCEGNPQKLAAILAFIDYFFSNDGQILMTYGPKADDAQGTNGFWYAEKQTNVNVANVAYKEEGSDQYTVNEANKGKYFIYKNEVYTGTFYNGRQVPTISTNSMNAFLGKAVNGYTLGAAQGTNSWSSSNTGGFILSYTDYARGVVGGALPIGNKDQGFEAQCTPARVRTGQDIVAIALNNNTLRHVWVTIDNGGYGNKGNQYWYTIMPSTLPYDTTDANDISTGEKIPTLQDNMFRNGSDTSNYVIGLLSYGYGADVTLSIGSSHKIPADANAALAEVNKWGDDVLQSYMQSAWNDINSYYNDYISVIIENKNK